MGSKPLQTVRDLADILNETDLSEIEYEQDGVRIKVARSLPPQTQLKLVPNTGACIGEAPVGVSPAPTEAPGMDLNNPGLVKSPMVGIAYLSPSPGSDPFVNIGDRVKKGQTLLIIEAMKVLNMIKAHRDGVIKQFLVKNEEPVEYDQPLLIIDVA